MAMAARYNPSSPAPTTSSSLNYSQYGSNSFGSPSGHRPSAPSISSSYSNRTAPRTGTSLRPSIGGGGTGDGRKPSIGDGGRKPDSREVARVHYRALKDFLREWLENESPSTRASAREKLTRLTKLQFQELSTDVYDELMRRLEQDNGPSGAAPFLPVRDDFHPKRNQARQKLATLPKSRFRDLASDVFYELRRRYPEFQDEEGEETMFDEPPPAPGPTAPRNQYYRNGPTAPPTATHQRQGSRNASGGSSRSVPSREGSRDFLSRPNGDYTGGSGPNMGMTTNDTVVPNKSRLKEEDIQVPYSRDSTVLTAPPARAGTGMLDRPTNDVVIPNKSRLREENIEVPFSRDDPPQAPLASGSRKPSVSKNAPGMVDRPTNDIVVPNKSRMREEEVQVPYARESRIIDRPRSSASSRPHSAASSNHDRTGRNDTDRNLLSPQGDDREYYDRMSFSSNVTSKSRATPGGPQGTGWDEEREQKIRSEYELRIAGLERRAQTAETERGEMKKKMDEMEGRRRDDDDEIRGLKERAALHASNLRSMQHELDLARDSAETARGHNESSGKQAQEEIGHWRERCERLEDELRRAEEERSALETANAAGGMNSDEAVAELKQEIHNLVDELQSLSARNDDLISERERDAQAMNEMEAKVDEYKRMYDAARVELRNLKASSVMFVPKPASDDHLPASPDGNIADINVLAFQTGIDGLLSSARSSQPSGVLSSMKAIVEAITEIGDDVKQFEALPNLDVDVSRLEHLKYESTNRLNALMQAARNHAMSSGLSPVSLIDGAAGQLSATVVEIIKLLKIRRSGEPVVPRNRSSMSIKDMVDRSRGGGTPTLDPRRTGTPNTETYSRSGTPTEAVTKSSTSAGSKLRDYAAGAKDYAQGAMERLREPLSASSSSNSVRRAFDGLVHSARSAPGERALSPIDTRSNGNGPTSSSAPQAAPAGPSNLRINSYASNASSIARSDSFDLDRKPSITASERQRPMVDTSRNNTYSSNNSYSYERDRERQRERDRELDRERDRQDSLSSRNGYKSPVDMRPSPIDAIRSNGAFGLAPRSSSPANGHGSSPMAPVSAVSAASMGSRSGSKMGGGPAREDDVFAGQGGGTDQEWEDVKPYLENQSSLLVNSIQNLLAAIRTGSSTPALDEHLSEVIAIASSIVAVSTDALPTSLRAEGNPLLKELVGNTNKLSEAQEQAKNTAGGSGFDKTMRQVIASASFGVAKALKSLMKLGVE